MRNWTAENRRWERGNRSRAFAFAGLLLSLALGLAPAPPLHAAWKLYLQDSNASVNPDGGDDRQLLYTPGVGLVTYTKNTLVGPVTPPTSATQFTAVAAGAVQSWYTYPLDRVTISGSVTFNIWARESATQANASITGVLYRANSSGVVISTIATATLNRTELTTTLAANNWSVTPTLTTLAYGDRLLLQLYIDDGGTSTMASLRTVTATLAGPTGGVSGDSWAQTTEALAPSRPSTGAVSAVATDGFTAGRTLVDGATGYTLAASLNQGSSPSPVAASVFGSGAEDTLTGLLPNTTYFLFARTHGSGSQSSWNTYAATATLAAAPVFSNFTGVAQNSLQFNWSGGANPSNTLYRVLVSTAPDPLTPGGAVVTSSYTYNTFLSTAGLSANTAYYFRVAAINRNSIYTAYTGVESAYTLAAVPSPAGFSLLAQDSMRLSWTAAANPAGTLYRVLVSTAPDPEVPAGAAVTSHDTYSFYLSTEGLTANTTYYFKAAGVNGDSALSLYSAAASTATLAAAPVFDSFSGAAYNALQFNFTGGNPAGTLYRVLTSTAADPMVPAGAVVTSSLTYNVFLSSGGLQPDTAYYFRAAAVNRNGVYSAYSVPEYAYTLLRFTPAFQSFSSVGGTSAQFNFLANGNAYPGTLFRVLASTAPDPAAPGGAVVTSSDTYNLYLSTAGLESSTTYYFTAAGVNKGGVPTAYSAAAGTSTLASVPSGFDFTGTSSVTVRLDWASSGGPGTLYQALVSTAADPQSPAGAAVTSSSTYNLYFSTAGLQPDTQYFFKVRAQNNNGVYTAYSAIASTRTLAVGVLAAPIAGALAPHISSVTAAWTLVGGATGYTLVVALDNSNPPAAVFASSTVLAMSGATVFSPALSPDTMYYTHVRANGPGASSTWSDFTDAATLLAYPPSAPDIGAVTAGSIGFFWSENGNAYPGTRFQVLYSTAADPLAPDGALVGSSVTYNIYLDQAGLPPNTLYRFRVAGLNKDGVATAYTGVSATSTLANLPVSPAFENLGSVSAGFSWAANGNPGGTLYRVLSSVAPDPLNPGGAPVASSDTYNLSLSSAGLAPNTTYYFRAAALNNHGILTAYTAPLATATLAADPAFPDFAGATESSIDFIWADNGNPAGTRYRVLVSTAANPLAPDGAAVTSSDTYNIYLSSAGLSSDTRYYFRVAALGRTGDLTGYTLATPYRTRTKAPVFSSFGAVGSGSIVLNWSPNGNPQPGTQYRVLASTAPDPASPGGAAVSVSDVYDITFSSSGLAANTSYYFRVAGVNGDGFLSAYTAPAATSTLLAYAPAFVDFTDVQTDALRFVWSHNGNADGTLYRVKVSTAADPLSPNGAVVSSSDTYEVALTTSGLIKDTQYYFRVAGVNNNGVLTAYSAVQSSRTLQVYTKLYLLDDASTAVLATGEERRLSKTRGAASVNYIKNTVTGAVTPPTAATQFTKAAGGAVQTWYTLPLEAMTVTGNVTFNIRALESAAQANATVTAVLYKADSAGVLTSTIAAAALARAELTITDAAQVWNVTPTPTALANGDRLALRLYIDDAAAVTMASGRTVTVSLGGPTSGVAGDSWIQVLEEIRPARPVISGFTGVAASQLTAAWTLVNETTGYLLAASLNPGLESVYSSSETIGNSATISVPALSANTTYFLYVRSSGEGESSSWAAYPGTSTLLAYPPAFSGFSGVAADSMLFDWSANGNADPGTQYRVQVSTAPDPLSPAGAVVTSSLTYNTYLSSAGISADTTYYFTVAGLNHNSVATAYTAVQGTATLLAFPPAFLNFTGVGQNAVQFNWSANGNRDPGTRYRVLVSTAADPAAPGGAAVTSSDTYNTYLSTAGLGTNTTYYFMVAGVNKNGIETAFTAIKATSTLAEAPSAPVFTAVGSGSAAFAWSAPANPAGRTLYRVLVSTAADPEAPAGAVVSSSLTYNLSLSSSGLAADTTYYFTATALNNNGVATAYSAVIGTATLLAYPPAFVNFSGVAAAAAQFNWSANGNAYPGTLFRVLSSTAPDPRSPGSAVVSSSYTYSLSLSSAGLTADTTYYFSVAGVNKNGVETAYAAAAGTATLLAFQPAFVNFTGVAESALQFNFSQNGNAYPGTLFRVLASTAADPLAPGGAAVLSSDTYTTSLASASLAANTTYYFSAAGVNKNGVLTAWTAVAGTSTLANLPSGLYSTGVTTRAIQLNWAESGNPPWTLYDLRVSTAADPLAPAGAPVTSSQTYNLYASTTGLAPSTYYYFRVRARNSNGVLTAWTEPPFQVRTLATGQIGSPASGSIDGVHISSLAASWSLVDGATGYTLAASLAADNPPTAIAAASTTINNEGHAYVFNPALSPDTVYYLFARANGDTVSSSWFAFPPAATLLAFPPAFSSFSNTDADSAEFSWNANGNVFPGTRFRVLVSTAPDPSAPGDSAVVSSDTYNASLAMDGLSADTTYYFRAAGVNKDGVLTAYTAPQATATWANAPAPAAFTGVAVNAVQFNWDAAGNRNPGTLYRVLVSTAPNPLSPGAAAVTSSDTYNLFLSSAGLAADTTYYFRAAALGVSGVPSAWTSVRSTATLVAYPPVAAGFTNVAETSVRFNWTANGNRDPGTRYRVLVSTAADPLAPAGAVVTSSITYNLFLSSAGLTPNTSYFFAVAASNHNSVLTAYTAAQGTATLANLPLSAVSTYSALGSVGFKVSWNAAGNPAGTLYEAQVSTASDFNAGAAGQAVSTAPVQGASYAFSGLLSSTDYSLRLRAVNHNGVRTAYTLLGSTRTLGLAAPSADPVTQVSSYSITVSWGLVSGATGYTLAASVNSGLAPSPVYASSATVAAEATVYSPALALNTTYYLFLRATGPGDAGPWAVLPPTSTLANQPLSAVSTYSAVTDSGFSVSWNANSNPLATSRYQVQVSSAQDFNAGVTDQVLLATAPAAGPGASFSGLSTDTYYYARVRALHNSGSYTNWTGLGNVKTLALPALHAAGDGVLIYGKAGSSLPQFRHYYGASNTFSAVQNTISGTPGSLFVIRTSSVTTRQEAVAAYVKNGTLRVLCTDGANWYEEWTQAVGGNETTRRFDIAYEAATGDALVLYSANAAGSNELGYRTKPGTAECGTGGWTEHTPLDPARTSGVVQWVKLVPDPRPSSSTIVAAWLDDNSDLSAMVWNGAAWENEPAAALETSLEAVTVAGDTDAFDLEFESLSGDLMLVWANSAGADGANGVRYATAAWSGGSPLHTWGNPVTPATFLDDATNLDLAANPLNNGMVFASIGNSGADLQIGYWSGSSWTNTANLDTTAQSPVAGSKLVSAAWLTSGVTTRWLVAYNDAAATNIGWYYGTSSTATAGADAAPTPAFANPQLRYELQQDPFNKDRAMLTVADSAYDLIAKRVAMTSVPAFTWTDAAGGAALEASLSSAAVGGHSFVYWGAPPSPVFEQSAYRFFANANSADVGAPLAPQDTLAAVGSAGSAFRLRALLHVGNVALSQNGQGFKLQYAGRGDGTCEEPANGVPAAYTDVTAVTALAFNDNAAVADNAALVANAQDPRHGTHVNSNQSYEELNASTNTVSAIARNQDGMWDFSLKDNGLAPGSVYCLRLTKNDGMPLEYYTVWPQFILNTQVSINEVYPSGASASEDWVELYNNSASTPSLSGWRLDYVENTIAIGGTPNTLWTGQTGAVINAYSTLTLQGLPVNLNPAQPYHVKLVNAAEAVADQVQWPGPGALSAGQSFARVTDGDPELFEIDPTPTKGYANAAATETIRIAEVSYGQPDRQFIELYNPSAVSTVTLTSYSLRNAAASDSGKRFRFTRVIYPRDYALVDFSSLSDDAFSFSYVFGAQGLAAAGDFMALETSTGAVADAVAWQSGAAYSRYNYLGAKTPLSSYAPANSASSIRRQPAEGSDTSVDSADFTTSASATPASRNNGAGAAAANTLSYPVNTQAPQFLARVFPLRLTLGAASAGAGNNLVFQRTGGLADPYSPHIYRLADIGFTLSSLSPQATAQAGYAFPDQDGRTLVSSATYRLTLNSDTGAVSAPQIALGTVTYHSAVHSVTASTAAPLQMNNATRAAMDKISVGNNSPPGFGALHLATVTFRLLDADLAPLTQAQARNLFNAVMLARDSETQGTYGAYEPAIDVTTAAYVPMNSISLDAAGLSTLTVAAADLWAARIPAGSTRAFYLVFESTQNAGAWTPNVFRVRFNAATAVPLDEAGGLQQAFAASAQVDTSSVALITPAQPPANSTWPYVSPSSAPVTTLAGIEGSGLLTTRSYIGSTDGYVRALGANGGLLWSFATSPLYPINSSPTDSEKISGAAYLYFANDNGDVYKIRDNGASATLVWKRELAVPVRSNIVVSGDKLYFGADDNKMHCIDKLSADGADCAGWADLAVTGVVSATPMVDNRTGVNTAWIGTESGSLVQLNTGSGNSAGSLNTGSTIKSSPFGDVAWAGSSNKLFLTSTDGKLYVAPLDLGSSEQPFNANSPIYTSPFLWNFDGVRYAFFGDDAGRMHKVSTQTWSEPAGWPFHAGGPIRSSPVIVSSGSVAGVFANYVYFGCDDGYIYGVNIDTGQLRSGWPVATGGTVRADVVVDTVEKTLTVGSSDGRTYVLNIGP